jgi:hypothetical protein
VDWTIVVSVLVALLLMLLVIASLSGIVFLTAATVLRGRFQRLMEQKMAHCKEMFNSWVPATAGAGSTAPEPCACAGPSKGGE